jgi:hypothetical protein
VRNILKIILALLSLVIWSCAHESPPVGIPKPVPTVVEEKRISLSWEKSHPERSTWTTILLGEVEKNFGRLQKASDLIDFCPKFPALKVPDQVVVISEIFVGMALYESAFNLNNRYVESTMGIDPVTGSQVVSEGLFQLSYQDAKWYPFCPIDYAKKNILSPGVQTICAVGIMAKQVDSYKAFKVSRGAYWAVLKTNSKYNKIPEITARTKALEVCK